MNYEAAPIFVAWDLDFSPQNLSEGAIVNQIVANIRNRLIMMGFEGNVTLYACGGPQTFSSTFSSGLYDRLQNAGFNVEILTNLDSSSDMVITTSIFRWIKGPRVPRVLFLITNRPNLYKFPLRALKGNGLQIIVAAKRENLGGLDNIPHYLLSWDDIAMPVQP